MAEYCEKCAKKYGFEPDYDAAPCEGCGEVYIREKKDWTTLLKVIGLILLASIVIDLILNSLF